MTAQYIYASDSVPPYVGYDGTFTPPVPPYSTPDSGDLYSRVERMKYVTLPIASVPCSFHTEANSFYPRGMDACRACYPSWHPDKSEAFYTLRNIVATFFAAIELGHNNVVSEFVTLGLVSPNVTTCPGETPLLAAVAVASLPTVRTLIALGATVNTFAMATNHSKTRKYSRDYQKRTPLQLAAQNGNLAIVRALMEDYGADDSLIAPDGAIALRLAADNGHRDIVAYLPARRGGATIRWHQAQQREMTIIRRTWYRMVRVFQTILWRIPRYFLYRLPLRLWGRRHKIIAWCKRLPARAKKHLIKLPESATNVAKKTARFVLELPEHLERVLQALIRRIKAIPKVLKAITAWIGRGLKTIGTSIFDIASKLVSFLHTVVFAVTSFLRGITLKDAWNGLCVLLKSIFVDMPKTIWSFLKTFGPLAYKILGDLCGFLGKVLWGLMQLILELVLYVPKKITKIIAALGRLFCIGLQELMIHWDPKRL